MRWYWYAVIGLVGYTALFSDSDDASKASYSAAPSTSVVAKEKRATIQSQADQRTAFESLFVTGNSVNVRAGPGVKFQILGKRYKGDKIVRIDQSGNWSKIQNGDGSAWISSNFVSTSIPRPAQSAKKAAPKRTVAPPSTREIAAAKKEIIRWSISQYPGSCPCPYNTDRAGRRCGGRSAWSKPGGYSPICYESDVSDARVKSYIARKRGAVN